VLVPVVEAAAVAALLAVFAYDVSPTIGAMVNAAAIARVSPNNNLDL
jgi:hypothetical protein